MMGKQATNNNQISHRIITISTTVKLKMELKSIWFATKFNPSVINYNCFNTDGYCFPLLIVFYDFINDRLKQSLK